MHSLHRLIFTSIPRNPVWLYTFFLYLYESYFLFLIPGPKIDVEFCICHDVFDMSKLRHGIWKYFCDADKCNFCNQLFHQLGMYQENYLQITFWVETRERCQLKFSNCLGWGVGGADYQPQQAPMGANTAARKTV